MNLNVILIVSGVTVGLILLWRMLISPRHRLSRFLFNSLLGIAALIIINAFGSAIHIDMAINTVSLLTSAVLGLPGMLLLLLVRWLYIM